MHNQSKIFFCKGSFRFKAVHMLLEVFQKVAQKNTGSCFLLSKLLFEDKSHFYCYFIAFLLFFIIISTDVTARSLLVQGHANAILRDHVFKTTAVYGVTECGLLCSRDLRCESFNTCTDKDKILCELNNATNEDSGKDFHWTITCSYYSTIIRNIIY